MLNYTSVLNVYPSNESLQACKTACKHSLQAGVSINLGFSKEVGANIIHGSLPLYLLYWRDFTAS